MTPSNGHRAKAGRSERIVEPRPFLKWAGGKTQLLDHLLARVPSVFNAYHEPFVGSGALFFGLVARYRLAKVYLSDNSAPLMDTYLALRDDVEAVIRRLKRHRHEKDYYYRLRDVNPATLSLVQRAARVIYLNKTCYNGLYRENRRGRFNVPFGRYRNPTICDEANLRAVSAVLQDVSVKRQHYRSVMRRAQPGDFVYFDPPYWPRSRTANFTAYDRNGFTWDDQTTLRDTCVELSQRRVYVMLSNSDTPLVRELYEGFNIDRVFATRSINSRGDKRGKIAELIIRNY